MNEPFVKVRVVQNEDGKYGLMLLKELEEENTIILKDGAYCLNLDREFTAKKLKEKLEEDDD